MASESGVWRVVVAVCGAILGFCLAGGAVFYEMADVGTKGLHGGPATLAAAMAGLFGGGLTGLLVLIVALRLMRER